MHRIGVFLLFIIIFISLSACDQSKNLWDKLNTPIEQQIPNIVSVTPGNGVGDVITKIVTIEFSKEMNKESIENSGIKIVDSKNNNPVSGVITLSDNNTIAHFTRDNYFDRGITYIVTIDASTVQDIYGNSLNMYDPLLSFSFSTKAFPYIIGFSPTGDPAQPNTNIVITFSEPMKTTGCSIEATYNGNSPQPLSGVWEWTEDPDTLTISGNDFGYGEPGKPLEVVLTLKDFRAAADSASLEPATPTRTFEVISSWVNVIDGLLPNETVASDITRPIIIKEYAGTPYMAYVNDAHKLRIVKYDASIKKWSRIVSADLTVGAGDIDLAVTGTDNACVAYKSDVSAGGKAILACNKNANNYDVSELSTGNVNFIHGAYNAGTDTYYIAYNQTVTTMGPDRIRMGLYLVAYTNKQVKTVGTPAQMTDVNISSMSLAIHDNSVFIHYSVGTTYYTCKKYNEIDGWDLTPFQLNDISSDPYYVFMTFMEVYPLWLSYNANTFIFKDYKLGGDPPFLGFPTSVNNTVADAYPQFSLDIYIYSDTNNNQVYIPYFSYVSNSKKNIMVRYAGVGDSKWIQPSWDCVSSSDSYNPAIKVINKKIFAAYRDAANCNLLMVRMHAL